MNLIIFILAHIFLAINFIYLQSTLLSDIRKIKYKRICSIGLTMSLLSALCAYIAISIGSSGFLIAYADFAIGISITFIGLAVHNEKK